MSARRLSSDWQLFQKMLPQKLFFVVSLSAGLSETLRLLYVVLVVQVVFPMSARRPSKDGLLFLKKLPQKLFFVVSLSAGLSESQVVIRCTCCSSCFPYVSNFISKKAQQGRLLFLKKLPQKLFFVVSLAAGLSESQVVISCTCCSSCFPYISKKTQQEDPARSRSIKY